jgi:hypothetical protein
MQSNRTCLSSLPYFGHQRLLVGRMVFWSACRLWRLYRDWLQAESRGAAGTRIAFDLAPLAGDRHRAPLDAGAVVASWQASPPIERDESPDRTARDRAPPDTGHASGNCCLPGTRHPDQATVSPIGRQCAASPSTWPTCRRSATRYRPTLAPLSLRGRLHRSRGRRPGRTAGVRVPPALTRPRQPRLASNPRATTRPRNARSAAGALPRLRPGPLAGDRHPAPLDAGAVVASWPASPIERTKPRPNCR